MRYAVIALLACVWIYLAYNAWQAHNMFGAALFIVVGIVITVYRLRRIS